ncbi:hypothetical protein HRI_004572300 [Hibiscus trionum]|uniref:Uncharacterized protein n=1 Tax=Hibiscus trionum TaxID=183268 RepID=A0A9W7J6T4_HIBTR|nr:hypothetical protein HRI_004572300 [Hibiscus trionum]
MSCFLLPFSLSKELESIMARLCWKKSAGRRGIHWFTWQSLCSLKEDGGMGFTDLSKFNIAMLAKQGWCLLQNPHSLVHSFSVLSITRIRLFTHPHWVRILLLPGEASGQPRAFFSLVYVGA